MGVDFENVYFNLFQEREVDERQYEENLEKFRQQIVEEERQKLLAEHATRLLGYLPKVSIKILAVYKNIYYLNYNIHYFDCIITLM